MNLDGDQFAEVVQPQGSLMRDDCLRLVVSSSAPERESDKIVMLGERQRLNAIQSMAGSLEVSGFQVVNQMGVRVAGLLGLLGREVSTLRQCEGGQGAKSIFLVSVRHAQSFNLFEGLCSIDERVKSLEIKKASPNGIAAVRLCGNALCPGVVKAVIVQTATDDGLDGSTVG